MKTVQTHFTIIFEAAEAGGVTAYIPEVPGAISEGETIDEARESVLSALEEVLNAKAGRGKSITAQNSQLWS